jgi:CelD/BcsL family acetyltransferase involved in cellulose biosynthesis
MINLSLQTITSIDDLRSVAKQWDDLWWRSDVALPTCRATALALWLEQFAKDAQFHALVVTREEAFVGALPLVRTRWHGTVQVARLPNNPWCVAGDLLIDRTTDSAAICELLADGVRRGPWSLAMFDEVSLASPGWHVLLDALRTAGSEVDTRMRYLIGQVEIAGDWSNYESSRSKNHRKHVRQMGRRMEDQGATELVVEREASHSEVARLLRRGCEVEDRSWKGGAGSSILQSPGMYDFYLRLVQHLVQTQGAQLHFLQHANTDAAFQLVLAGKGTLFPAKIAYDPALSKFSPWQILMHRWLESLHAQHAQEGTPSLVDFYGPLMDASAKWSTRTYPLGKVMATTAARGSATLFKAIQSAKRLKAKWRPCAPAVLPEIYPLAAGSESSKDERREKQDKKAVGQA